MTLYITRANQSKAIRIVTWGLRTIGMAIALAGLHAMMPVHVSWMVPSASAREELLAPSETVSVYGSASDLGEFLGDTPLDTLGVNCLQAEEMGVLPPHCPWGGEDERGLNPELFGDVEETINSSLQDEAIEPTPGMVIIELW